MKDYINRLLGKDDPLDEVIEERKRREREQRQGEDGNNPNNDDWPYRFTEVDSLEIAGNEVHSIDEDGNHFAGEYVRSMIEDRRYRPEGYTWFGYTRHPVRGVEPVGIPHESLFRHTALFGVTGFGKSTVMKNNMLQWMQAGYGLCFIDPKGDDSSKILRQIPEHRKDDVLWVELGNAAAEEVVGFNFFDTYTDPGDPGHENEVDEVVSDFVGILQNTTQGWGATMENIATAVTKQLVKAEEDYNVVDMYKILNNEDEREAFAEQFGNDIEQMYLQRLANTETEEIDPLIRRVREWVENPVTREIIAHEGSEINITEAVEDGKLMLIDTSSIPDDDIKRLVSTAVIRRIWSTIQTRSNIPEEEREPYFLCIDEFDKVAGEGSNIEDMLSKGRSLRLSVFVANQQPNQLPESIRDGIYGNCDNLFTFNPGPANVKDAKTLAQTLGGIEAHKLMSLSQFQLLGRVTINGDKTDPMLVHTFPEYPPLRDDDEARRLKRRSIEQYGCERQLDTDDTSGYGILGRKEGSEPDDAVEINEDGDSITPKQVLECVYTARIKHDTRTLVGKTGWVHKDDLQEEIQKYVGADIGYASVLDNVMEKMPDAWLETELDGDAYFRLTGEGEQKAFQQDTGSSASGGKTAHRVLLKEGHKAFTKLGYNVRLPTQEGEELPDGIAEPPICPVKESESFEEAQELEQELAEEYPRLYDLFEDSTVAMEAESTTITKPKQTIKNLAKAVREGQKCVFLVKDGSSEYGAMDHWAKAGHGILTNPPFVADADKHGNRTFYNTSSFVELKDGSYALQRIDDPDGKGYCTWREVGKQHGNSPDAKVVLEGNEDTIARFDDASDLRNPGREAFPYHYYRDPSEKVTVVQDSEGNLVGEYDNKDQMKKDGFRPIYQPLIPEHVFPKGEYPSDDTWEIVVIPGGDNKEKGPQLYRDGDLEPLFPEDYEPEVTPDFDTDDDDDDSDDDDTDGGGSDGGTSDGSSPGGAGGSTAGEPDNAKNADEVPIATGKDKSTNEVVKESGEEWTKPEPGDDDYNPAKDNSNYRTGYNEENSGDWTGGLAREKDKEGDFEDYEPPSKKDNDTDDGNGGDSLNEAAMEGMMENDGTPPDFRDERHLTDDEEDEESEDATHPETSEGGTDVDGDTADEVDEDEGEETDDEEDDEDSAPETAFDKADKPREADPLTDF